MVAHDTVVLCARDHFVREPVGANSLNQETWHLDTVNYTSGASGHKNLSKPRIVDLFYPFKVRCHQAQACALLMHEPVLGFDTFCPFPWYAEQGYKHQLTPTLA